VIQTESRRISVIAKRAEKAYVQRRVPTPPRRSTSEPQVVKGQPLMEVYNPAGLSSAAAKTFSDAQLADYLQATAPMAGVNGQRLMNLDVPDAAIVTMEAKRQVSDRDRVDCAA